jgi:hypothetical protein
VQHHWVLTQHGQGQNEKGADVKPLGTTTMAAVAFRIADLTIALTSEDPALTSQIVGATTQFLVREAEPDDAEPDVRVRAVWGNLSERIAGKQLFDSRGPWQLYAANGSLRLHFTSLTLGLLPYKVASFDPAFTVGEICLHRPYFPPGHAVNPLEYPLDELLMIHLLAQGRGVELHACGVMDSEGRGYLFAGQSGAGKTTMARLWQNPEDGKSRGVVTFLSDDRIIVRHQDGKFWMYGTPWHGEGQFASPARAPLQGVYLLRHGSSSRLVPLRRSEAAARLMTCSFPPFHDSRGLSFTLSFLEKLVAAVPCLELSFTPDARVIELVRGA